MRSVALLRCSTAPTVAEVDRAARGLAILSRPITAEESRTGEATWRLGVHRDRVERAERLAGRAMRHAEELHGRDYSEMVQAIDALCVELHVAGGAR